MYEAVYSDSVEKIVSHELINDSLFKWIEFNFKQTTRIITMPARSGKQENQIIAYIQNLENRLGLQNKVQLLTYDWELWAFQTNVKDCGFWKHTRCSDIFDYVNLSAMNEGHTAAWFDLCGGLTDNTLHNVARALAVFAHGSLFYITLQIHAVRGLKEKDIVSFGYKTFSNTPVANSFVTISELKNAAAKVGRYLRPIFDPYIYKRGKAHYGVFGYIVGKHTTTLI